MKRDNFYRRDPGAALAGMTSMTLEERGVYNTVLDLLYSTWRPVEDNRQFIARWCNCAVQKLNPILERLIAQGKLIRFEDEGAPYISNQRFEAERAEVRGPGRTPSGRGKVGQKSGEVGEKSPGVGEKSASVAQNTSLLGHEVEEFQPPDALDKNREEENRSSEAIASSQGAVVGANAVREVVDAIWAVWPSAGRKTSSRHLLAEAIWALLTEGVSAARLIAAAFAYAADKPAWGASGRPKACHAFYAEGRWENFGAPADAVGLGDGPADLFGFDGPAQVRAAVVAAEGDAFAKSYLDPSTWRESDHAVVTQTQIAAEALRRIFGKLERAGVRDVVWKGAA